MKNIWFGSTDTVYEWNQTSGKQERKRFREKKYIKKKRQYGVGCGKGKRDLG